VSVVEASLGTNTQESLAWQRAEPAIHSVGQSGYDQVMYERFYGLRERPFELAPNPHFLYLANRHREALSHLRYGLTTPRGFTLLLGEAGTGKTTLVQAVLEQLTPDTVECVLLTNPTLTRSEFLEFLADGFNLSADSRTSKVRLLSELRDHLEKRHQTGRLTALVLDEAQSLPYELLEEVRLLSNIEVSSTKLLNVVLAGQPELAERLNDPALRQLKQRVSLRCELGPLNFADTAAYVAGRLRIAGGNPVEIFSREAVTAIHECSGGVPRTINVVCDNALISGFAVQARPVPRSIVVEVMRDFDLKRATPPGPAATATEANQNDASDLQQGGLEPDSNADSATASLPKQVDGNRTRLFSFFKKTVPP
jgi:general secretion pathway protein A